MVRLLTNPCLSLILPLLLFLSCAKEKTDEELLERDRVALAESLDSYKVSMYRFGKIVVRASMESDTTNPEFLAVKGTIDNTFKKINNYNSKEELSVFDYVSIYKDYRDMQAFVEKTDEDIFPTVFEVYTALYRDPATTKIVPLQEPQKLIIQNTEHGLLSVAAILSRSLGKEVSLYECYKTNPELMADTEIKSLLRYLRGFLFFEKELYYLSEDEISGNITWLSNNPDVSLELTQMIFGWDLPDNTTAHTTFHAMNHLFRGCDRLMMEREIDEQRALEDFQVFLDDCQKLGISNELVWAVKAFVALKYDDKETAIAALTQLKGSALLTDKEKLRIEESVVYLKEKESDELLTGTYDKVFISKIATKYVFAQLAEVNWKQLLQDQNVPDGLVTTVDELHAVIANLEKYSATDAVKEVGTDLKDEGKALLEKSKNLLN